MIQKGCLIDRLNGLIIEKSNPLGEATAWLENKLSPFRRGSLARTNDSLYCANSSMRTVKDTPVATSVSILSHICSSVVANGFGRFSALRIRRMNETNIDMYSFRHVCIMHIRSLSRSEGSACEAI